MWNFSIIKLGRYIHVEIRFLIFRISWFELTKKKVTIRFEISWGWEK